MARIEYHPILSNWNVYLEWLRRWQYDSRWSPERCCQEATLRQDGIHWKADRWQLTQCTYERTHLLKLVDDSHFLESIHYIDEETSDLILRRSLAHM